MYSGINLSTRSGKIVGVHQKIDRIVRRKIKKYVPTLINFPNIKTILLFEGKNGADGLKQKSPSVDEPWHFINPNDPNDRAILTVINDHIYNLSVALKKNDEIRAGFEAAFASHAVVDGLTPAHHYPLGEKVKELWGKDHDERGTTVKAKNIIHGVNRRDTIHKNWEYYGAKGVMTTHFNFEIGVASTVAAEHFKSFQITQNDIEYLKQVGFDEVFMESLQKINSLNMYPKMQKSGWTKRLARQTKETLVPEIMKVVALSWIQAILLARQED